MSQILCIRLEDETVKELRRRAKLDKQDVEVSLSLLVEELVRRAPKEGV